jgi:hypothetical protein
MTFNLDDKKGGQAASEPDIGLFSPAQPQASDGTAREGDSSGLRPMRSFPAGIS